MRTTFGLAAGSTVMVLLLAACGEAAGPGAGADETAQSAESSATQPTGPAGGSATQRGTEVAERPKPSRRDDDGIPEDARVVAVSIDGLGSRWVTPTLTPTIDRLLGEGAGTRNARTEVEQTDTLPNHTGMVTGRRIDARSGGHGVTWNSETSRKVRSGVDSVFSVIDKSGGTSAVVTAKQKFNLWPRSWPGRIESFEVKDDGPAAVDLALQQINAGRDLTFLHLAGPDRAGHKAGWDSPAYRAAVTQADDSLARLVAAIAADKDLADEIVVVLTADHGGRPGQRSHADPTLPVDYTIPFVVWGVGVSRGDLYALNDDYREPGLTRPSYDGAQPVRNGMLGNLVTDILGLAPIPGSELNVDHDLTVDD